MSAQVIWKIVVALWPLWVLVVVALALDVVKKLWERHRLLVAGLADIDRMDGQMFEKYLEVLFRRLGYRVVRTPYCGDWGADLVIEKDGHRSVVQAKRHKGRVGVKAVQEALGAKSMYDCQHAIVVTNSTYTNQAMELARKAEVELWDRDRLIDAGASASMGISESLDSKVSTEAAPVSQASPGEFRRPAPMDLTACQPTTVAITGDTGASDAQVCAVCGKPVSDAVAEYCRKHAERFGGSIYCYQHQREVRRRR